MEKLYEWVDEDPPPTDQTFSVRRTGKLFVAIMLGSILAGLPLALFQAGLLTFKDKQAERQQQEKLKHEWAELGKAAREGKTGEAFKRLFGVEASEQNAK